MAGSHQDWRHEPDCSFGHVRSLPQAVQRTCQRHPHVQHVQKPSFHTQVQPRHDPPQGSPGRPGVAFERGERNLDATLCPARPFGPYGYVSKKRCPQTNMQHVLWPLLVKRCISLRLWLSSMQTLADSFVTSSFSSSSSSSPWMDKTLHKLPGGSPNFHRAESIPTGAK